MNSMTGYGYKEILQDGTQLSVEIKSVNNRFLDLNINMPSYLNPIESRIRQAVSNVAVRGKIDLSIRIKELNSSAKVNADTTAARMYFDAIKSVASSLGLKDDSINLSLIVNQDGVLNVTHDYDVEKFWDKINPVLTEVLEQFAKDRAREGENLKKDLLKKLDVLDECAQFFSLWQPKMEAKFKEQITSRFNELLGDHADENRIMTEVAAMLVKYTINEEIIRLKSHLEALRKEITQSALPGKRLDFICQEANREINTIGSKNQFAEVGAMVVNAKDALENIREQSKNVE
ncbi:YicC/YloC family endoribonuclease [Treponema sp.]|uniref:YicC/YloC family endoribonuclease n=1 Tax=Treponema sp. TaxID=166 RepID=UPI0025FDE00C|nr:YicC/YloC family endoribonuclease [Treponema sp.]MCR5217994.1 YicC family protein [Treponema sp.]